jgi:hypothetical protein
MPDSPSPTSVPEPGSDGNATATPGSVPALQGPTSSSLPGPSLDGDQANSPVHSGFNPGVSVSVIVGITLGIVGLFVILGCLTSYCRRRKGKRQAQRKMRIIPDLSQEQEKTD